MPEDSMVRGSKPSRRTFLATSGAAGVAAFAGCTGNGNGDDETVRIGAPYLLSGVGEAIGTDSLNGAELAAQEINDDGGVDGREIEVIPQDVGEADAARVFRSLVSEDDVHGLIGLTNSGVAVATADLIEQLGVPQVLCDIGTPYVTEWDTDEYGSDQAVGNRYRFRANANTVHSQYAITQDIEENLDDVETVGFVGPDYAFGHQEWDYFQAYAEGRGLDLEFDDDWVQFIDLGETDMSASLQQVISQEPDLIVSAQWSDDMVTFIRQSQEQNIEDHVDEIIMSLGVDITQWYALGEEMPAGWRMHGWHFPGTPDIDAQHDWVQRYIDEYDREPGGFSVSAYEAIYHYAQVIEEHGDDPDDIVDGLEQNVYDGPRGEHEFLEDSHQAPVGAPYSVTTDEWLDDHERVGTEETVYVEPTRDEIHDLLEGSGLPPGI